MANFQEAIRKTLIREGGAKITDDPTDAGGLTKYGISQRAYPSEDIRALTEARAMEIYRRDYWDKIRGNEIISQKIAESLFDSAVNMGVKSAIRLAQTAAGVTSDGVIGAGTIADLNNDDENLFIMAFALAKIARYCAICRRDRTQSRFLLGWVSRALEGV